MLRNLLFFYQNLHNQEYWDYLNNENLEKIKKIKR